MLSIFTEISQKNTVETLIKNVDRLEELVEIKTSETENSNFVTQIYFTPDFLKLEFDWFDNRPPLVIPKVTFSEDNFYALVYFALGNTQKSFEFLDQNSELYLPFLASVHLQMGWEIPQEMVSEIKEKSFFNYLILQRFGNLQNRISEVEIQNSFKKIIQNKEEEKFPAFKNQIAILIENQQFEEAENIFNTVFNTENLSEKQKISFEIQWIDCKMSQIKFPLNREFLDKILEKQNHCIAFLIQKNMPIQAGLQLMNLSEIANLKEDYTEAKDAINRAILIFKNEEIVELMGDASVRKAVLLYTWSKNGQPQYYKSAINAYQDALKVFKRDEFPEKFAEIKHNLALIYTEIPASNEEGMIWSAFSASCFKEALEIYTETDFPYEFAMASHNYATALMNYPEAKLHQNLDKSQHHFSEALKIRNAENFPTERALTLVNQLELFWQIHNENAEDELENLAKMEQNISEIEYLTKDSAILDKLAPHKEEISKLKTLL